MYKWIWHVEEFADDPWTFQAGVSAGNSDSDVRQG